MNTQTVEFKISLGINSYCAIHSDQDVEVQINQREGGLVDYTTQPCHQCLAGAEAFGRANQIRDDEANLQDYRGGK